jgi:hypothetical protein
MNSGYDSPFKVCRPAFVQPTMSVSERSKTSVWEEGLTNEKEGKVKMS